MSFIFILLIITPPLSQTTRLLHRQTLINQVSGKIGYVL